MWLSKRREVSGANYWSRVMGVRQPLWRMPQVEGGPPHVPEHIGSQRKTRRSKRHSWYGWSRSDAGRSVEGVTGWYRALWVWVRGDTTGQETSVWETSW